MQTLYKSRPEILRQGGHAKRPHSEYSERRQKLLDISRSFDALELNVIVMWFNHLYHSIPYSSTVSMKSLVLKSMMFGCFFL